VATAPAMLRKKSEFCAAAAFPECKLLAMFCTGKQLF
jgi:hypothetical protein